MKGRLDAKGGPAFDDDKVRVIHNWEDEEFITPVPKSENPFSREHGLDDQFTVLYSGNIAEFHDLETLVGAAAELDGEEVQFLIIGEGDNKERIVELAERHGLRGDTVEFLPYQPWERLPYSLTAGDVSVVAVKEGFEGVVVSSKLYTAMAAGRPVLTIANANDDEARIVDRFDAGVHVEQGATEEVAAAIRRWKRDPEFRDRQGRNARTAFEEHFVKDAAVDRYYEMLSEPDGEGATA
jgi:glycosyltransferase involved in cell wall biosynthesis